MQTGGAGGGGVVKIQLTECLEDHLGLLISMLHSFSQGKH